MKDSILSEDYKPKKYLKTMNKPELILEVYRLRRLVDKYRVKNRNFQNALRKTEK